MMVDGAQYAAVRARSAATGAPVAVLVRRAIAAWLGEVGGVVDAPRRTGCPQCADPDPMACNPFGCRCRCHIGNRGSV